MQNIKQMLEDIHGEIPAGLKGRIEALESQLKRRAWASLPGVNEGAEKFSMFRAVMAIKTGNWAEAGYEKSVMAEAAKKSLGYGTDTLGGYLVPAQAIPDLIPLLLPNVVCAKLGARMLTDLVGAPVLMPRLNAGATVQWLGENINATPADLAFGQVQLTPKKAMALVEISNSLIRMSLPAAEQIIMEDLGRQLALAVDIAALRGPGTNNQPLGILNTPGVGTVNVGTDGNGATLANLDVFSDLEYALEVANALQGTPGYAFHPAVRRAIKKLKVSMFSNDAGSLPMVPFWTFSGFEGDKSIAEAISYPFQTSTQIPVNLTVGNKSNCTEIYFGNWQELLIGQWAGLRILASDVAGTAFASDQTWLRIIMEVDVALRHPKSFAVCSDLAIA